MIKLSKLLIELYQPGDTDEPPYSRFDTAREGTIEEGPNDPNIFKAIFMAGGPGSGKTFVADKLALPAKGLKPVNSDKAFEFLMKRKGLDPKMPPEQTAVRDVVRQRAKDITSVEQSNYLDGRLGMVIDSTANDPEAIYKLKSGLETYGYQTMMVFVNTGLETALKRNAERPRSVPEDVVRDSHEKVRRSLDQLKRYFKKDFVEILNDDGTKLDTSDAEKRIRQFLSRQLTAQAKDWINKQKQK